MSRKNKWFVYTLCAFIILSVYKDLSRVEDNSTHSPVTQPSEELNKTYAVHRIVRRGDTLLSIIEEIHEDTEFPFHMDDVINDFKAINNGADPYELIVQQSYYFPLYMY